jgi:hypothetical protein
LTRSIFLAALAILLLSQATRAQSRTTRRASGAPSAPASNSTTPGTNYPNLKAQAEETANAFARKDFNTIVDTTYPKVVEFMGGREKMIPVIEQGVKQAEREGITFVSITVDEPKGIVNVGKRLFGIVPTRLRMRVPEGTLVGESFMIGVSEDGGKKWTFIDGAGADKHRLRALFPSAADKLQLPEKKQPVMYPGK